METIKLDDYIDLGKTGKQTTDFIKQVQEAIDAVNKLRTLEVDLGKVKTNNQLKATVAEMNASLKTLEASVKNYTTLQRAAADADLAAAKAKKETAAAAERQSKAALNEAKATVENAKAKEVEARYAAILAKEKDKVSKAAEMEVKEQQRLENAYEQLKAKYKDAADQSKRFGAAYGTQSQMYRDITAEANKYYAELIKLETAVGQSQRMVGQYGNATMALNQVLREAPAFANSFATGISAIGNNIPVLIDEIGKLKAANLELVAAGQQPIPIFKTLAASVFSFAGLLPIAFLALQMFGKELVTMVSNLTSTKAATDKYNDAQKALYKTTSELNDVTKAQIDLIRQTREERLNALKSEIDLAEKSGSQQTRLFALRKKLAAEESTIAQQQLANAIKAAEAEDINVSNGVKGREALLNMLRFAGSSLESQKNAIKDLAAAQTKGDKDAIESAQKRLDAVNAMATAEKNQYDTYSAILQNASDKDSAVQQLAAEEAKFSADERRKLALETARIESDTVVNKNTQILNSDRSTMQEQLDALGRIAAARKRVIDAERDDVLNDPESSDADRVIARRKAAGEILALELETNSNRLQVSEDFRLRELTALKESADLRRQEEIKLKEDVLHADNVSFSDRMEALAGFIAKQREAIEADLAFRLKSAGFTDAEVEAVRTGQQVQIQGKKITAEELLAIQADYEVKSNTLAVESIDRQQAILKSALTKQTALRNENLEEVKRIYEGLDLDAARSNAQQQKDLADQLRAGELTYEGYRRAVAKADAAFLAKTRANRIAAIEGELSYFKNAEAKKAEAQAKVNELSEQLTQARTDGERRALNQRLAIAQEELARAKSDADKKTALERQLLDARAALNKAYIDQRMAEEVKLADLRKQLVGELIALGQTLVEGFYQRQDDAVREQMELNEQKREREIEIANATITNQQQREQAIAEADARAEARRVQLEKQQEQNEVRKARIIKAMNLFAVGVETAQAVAKISLAAATAKAQAAAVLANPLTAPYFPIAAAAAAKVAAQIPLTIAIGAIRLAAVAATPIPKYFKGRSASDPYEGPAWVDDGPSGKGGAPEVVLRRTGEIEIGGNTPRLTYMRKGDIVLPDAKALIHNPKWAQGYAPGSLTANYSNPYGADQTRLLKRTASTLEQIKEDNRHYNRVKPRGKIREGWVIDDWFKKRIQGNS
ncbi:hypothetical protein [Flaviaesturariibacter amylovorans]|uniref:Uncharacterized protein n=1 Tax=Flaviaesturariibacter amylovorans TaxID=1084520 RepID=A0ABP8GPA6_9BACT